MNEVAQAFVCVLCGLRGSRGSGLWGQLGAGRVCGVQKEKWEAVRAGVSGPCPSAPPPVPSSLWVPTEDGPTTSSGPSWCQPPSTSSLGPGP